eukprot:Polyplicarium_translucidae@DN2638_c0_g1_i4.p2
MHPTVVWCARPLFVDIQPCQIHGTETALHKRRSSGTSQSAGCALYPAASNCSRNVALSSDSEKRESSLAVPHQSTAFRHSRSNTTRRVAMFHVELPSMALVELPRRRREIEQCRSRIPLWLKNSRQGTFCAPTPQVRHCKLLVGQPALRIFGPRCS